MNTLLYFFSNLSVNGHITIIISSRILTKSRNSLSLYSSPLIKDRKCVKTFSYEVYANLDISIFFLKFRTKCMRI